MAEVRKNKKNAKYDIDNINTSKSSKKEVKKVNEKKNTKMNKTKKDNKNSFVENVKNFFREVKGEFDKIHWLGKNDMIRYSIATIMFVIFCSLFFYLINILFALVQSLI